MDRNYFVEFRQRIVFHRNHRAVVPGIVHEDVNSAEFFPARRDDVGALGLLRQVGSRKTGAPTATGDFIRGRAEFFLRARRQKNRRALSREKMCDGAADPATRAGNQCNAIFEFQWKTRIKGSWKGGKPLGSRFSCAPLNTKEGGFRASP